MMTCKDCALKNTFPEDIAYCMALCRFIDDIDEPPCKLKHFVGRDLTKERHIEILEAIRNLK